MNKWLVIVQFGIKIIFYVLVPVVVIFFRAKKKLRTPFAVGLVLTSIVFGFIAVNSVYEDPVDHFIKVINARNLKDSKKSFKMLIQDGSDRISQIDEKMIIERDFYHRLRADLRTEYIAIARKSLKIHKVKKNVACGKFLTMKYELGYLKNGLRMISYAESIGGGDRDLKERLLESISSGEKIISALEKKCE